MRIYKEMVADPEMADLAIDDLRRWQIWAAVVSQFILILVGAFVGLVADGQLWILGWALRGDSLVGRETGQFPWATVLLMQVGALVGGLARDWS